VIAVGGLREVAAPFVVTGPSGVAVRDRLRDLSSEDEQVLRLVGAHLGSLASRDLKARCMAGLGHSAESWAARKRGLTAESSSRWAGSITKATHDQWALARRGQAAHIHNLAAGVAAIRHRLSLPVGAKGTKRTPGGYRSRQEWHSKTRRLRVLEDRLGKVRADREAGRVRVVRGGRRLARTRHHLAEAGLTAAEWRRRWEAGRWFLQADGESGKRFGNETIRITPDGEVSIKLPVPLVSLANAAHGRYVLAGRVRFSHRGAEWADQVAANRAVAYRIHNDTGRGRWYLTASWQIPPSRTVPLQAALTDGVIGVDTNADHLAAWCLDTHGNPCGEPRRFPYTLTGPAGHRDAQVRRPSGRAGTPRPHPPPALGHILRREGDRDRGPRLPDRENQGEARPQAMVPAAHLRHAHRQTPRPAHLHGRRRRHHDHRRRPRLHQQMGRPALAEAPHQHHP
jgi:hypothetical protein